MANVLVTGGTGMLGRRLVTALVERGHGSVIASTEFNPVEEPVDVA